MRVNYLKGLSRWLRTHHLNMMMRAWLPSKLIIAWLHTARPTPARSEAIYLQSLSPSLPLPPTVSAYYVYSVLPKQFTQPSICTLICQNPLMQTRIHHQPRVCVALSLCYPISLAFFFFHSQSNCENME